ncbi:nucleotidyltransferase-like protein [Nonomuraea polychroma]|uniref:Nucleotidyltransferase-like protein n=1 Tax=Nonomuraea polychroma TaxID=46176 RepID=A0A438M0B7_9ACTN|nr:nucleotidyltransferase domain-containing protein [Nonomuraea polychroma]RVX39057.1 nucleotidyltransferase-like protein [Nonomuraea polychroma]
MSTESSKVPSAPRLADIRSRWLSAATAGLHDDPGVAGAALVGSLGAGRADDWSDIDLLVVVDDAHLDDYAVPGRLPSGPGTLAAAFDARHNGPRGTRALGMHYIVDRLPLWVDWHIYPISRAGWAADSTVILDRQGFDRLPATFSELLSTGESEPPTPKRPIDHQMARLAMVPIAGKRIARRSPETARMIEFLGGPYAPDSSWQHHLATLRRLLDGFAALGLPDSVTAGHAYLDLVKETLD